MSMCLLTGVAALLVPGSFCDSASETVLEARRFALRVHGPPGLTRRLRDVGRECARAVQRQLGTDGARDEWVDVYLLEEGASPPTRGETDVSLTTLLGPTEAIHKLCLGLLARECRAMAPDRTGVSGSLDWLAAGCAFDVLFGTPGLFDSARFTRLPVVRRAARSSRLPRVTDLVASPVPPQWELCYRLYCVHCRLLFEAARGGEGLGPGALVSVLELEAHGREPAAALSFVVAPGFRSGEGLQAWYERRIGEVALRLGGGSSAEETAAAVSGLTSLPTVGPGRDGRCSVARVPLERAVGRAGNPALYDEALGRLVVGLGEAVARAPRLMQPGVVAHATALQHLREGRKGAFRRGIRRARKSLATSLARQQGVEALVDDIERRVTPFSVRFAAHLAVIEGAEQQRRTLNPELADYLDRMERGDLRE